MSHNPEFLMSIGASAGVGRAITRAFTRLSAPVGLLACGAGGQIGKMGVPDNILHKPGPLNEQEWEIMRKHPTFAYEMLASIDYLKPALEIPYCHHEKWDGSGYPRGLRREQIPLSARIFAMVDVWDALSSERPYRPAWPTERVMNYIREQAGSHFDPFIVEVFLQVMAQSK
jgi:HD-GYP domain-containing protein (c-di-GMP phosphodiesterase class II)